MLDGVTSVCVYAGWHAYVLADLRLAVGQVPGGYVQDDFQRHRQTVNYSYAYAGWSDLCMRMMYVYLG